MINPSPDFDPLGSLSPSMSDAELEGFRSILYDEVGITLTQAKRHMVTARLSKRLKVLGIGTYGEYLTYLKDPAGRSSELDDFIDVMTTNKTEFFREQNHYAVLTDLLVSQNWGKRATCFDPLKIWSAACSTGEEPHSIAMLLFDYFGAGSAFQILATDVCRGALARAESGMYTEDVVKNVPQDLKLKFLMRGKERRRGFYRITPEIRACISFERLNLMDDFYDVEGPFHAIWCRNVMIYFDTATKVKLVRRLCRHLAPGGFFFIGHSESLNGITDELAPFLPAVYQKPWERAK